MLQFFYCTVRLIFLSMTFYTIAALINLTTSIVLGILVLLSDIRSSIHRMFAGFAAAIGFWSFCYFFWQISGDMQSASFWIRMLMTGAILITPVYFHFIALFLDQGKKLRPVIVSGYIFIFFYSIINWIPGLFVSSVTSREGFEYWPIAGPFFLSFLVLWIFYAIYSELLLLRASRDPRYASMRTTIYYLLIGTTLGYVGGSTNYFLWFNIPILPIGNVLVASYVFFVGYAILKHQLFNMKVAAAEFMVFLLWLFIFVRMLIAITPQDQLSDLVLLAVILIGGVFLIQSVNKEVKSREYIEKQEYALEAINKQQENLLHFMSHEIKGYLTKSEAGFAAITQGDFGTVSPELMGMADAALTDVRRGVRTVMDILDASNLKKGTVTYKKQVFDMKDIVTRMVDELRPAADEKHLTIDMRIAWEIPCKVMGDEEKIREHVVRNLIDNAIKYTPSGSIAIEVSRKDGTVRFAIADSGVGITPEDMARLFTEGGHGKDSIKVNVHSTGYGLFIAKTIVDAHGGTIRAESKGAGTGSRFIVELPAV